MTSEPNKTYKRQIFKVILFTILGTLLVEFSGVLKRKHPLSGLGVKELVQAFNYTVEHHEVVTEDGYILTLHRLPYKENSTSNTNSCRTPVLLLPGYINSAADFLCLGPNKSLAYFLVDAGYDVWIGNYRGTVYSRKHATLHPDRDEEYWNFGTDEIGLYDVSAMVDYVLQQTGSLKLHGIGISQSAALSLVLLSERPDYNNKIHSMSMIAPGVFVRDTRSSFLFFLAYSRNQLDQGLKMFGRNELLSQNSVEAMFLKLICHEDSLFSSLCVFLQFSVSGINYDYRPEDLAVIYSYMPAGSSRKQFINHGQLIWKGKLSKYDYGHETNLLLYGQETPPPYILSRAKVPVAIYYSANDWLSTPEGIDQLAKSLPNVVKVHLTSDSQYTHSDFLYGPDLWTNYVREMIDEINKY